VRTFEISKHDGTLTVTDAIDLDRAGEVESAIIVDRKLNYRDGVIELSAGREQVTIAPLPGTVLGNPQRHTYNDHSGKPAYIDRIVVKPKAISERVEMGFTVRTSA